MITNSTLTNILVIFKDLFSLINLSFKTVKGLGLDPRRKECQLNENYVFKALLAHQVVQVTKEMLLFSQRNQKLRIMNSLKEENLTLNLSVQNQNQDKSKKNLIMFKSRKLVT